MAAPGSSVASTIWAVNPDIITWAIYTLAAAVLALGGIIVKGGKWIAVYMMKQMDERSTTIEIKLTKAVGDLSGKLDRVATSLETLTLTTSVQIAEIKTNCKANHHRSGDIPL